MLNDNERKKYETIKRVIAGELTRKEAASELKLNIRQIDRLKKIYKESGQEGFIHGNRGKPNPNKKNDNLINELEELYLNEYYDYNFEHFYEKVVFGKYSISYDVMLKVFTSDDIISPLAHKKTVKNYNEKMKKVIENKTDNENIDSEKIELYKSRIIAVEKVHIRRANNLYVFGQEVQMDACQKLWFGNISSYLHLAVDKATKKVLFGWLEYEEITKGYFVLLYNIIINYGIPEKIKTDNRNSFSNQKNKVDTTQFGTICNMLGIKLITTSVSTSKANVERENATFKNRLIAELRHEGIEKIEEANEYLNKIFIPKMNKKFSYEINNKTTKMKANNYTEEELNLIISEKYNRIIDNASSIKYDKKYYIPINPRTGEVMAFMNHTKCLFIITYNGEYWCQIEDKYYQLMEVENRDKTMKKEKDNKKEKEVKKYIPTANHPWKKSYKI